ncbi:hypothetical protein N8824_00590 [Candidatus Pelagibacter sp.]|nr:hypothetical protein [Candidatus Pelagibacter sp.]
MIAEKIIKKKGISTNDSFDSFTIPHKERKINEDIMEQAEADLSKWLDKVQMKKIILFVVLVIVIITIIGITLLL